MMIDCGYIFIYLLCRSNAYISVRPIIFDEPQLLKRTKVMMLPPDNSSKFN